MSNRDTSVLTAALLYSSKKSHNYLEDKLLQLIIDKISSDKLLSKRVVLVNIDSAFARHYLANNEAGVVINKWPVFAIRYPNTQCPEIYNINYVNIVFKKVYDEYNKLKDVEHVEPPVIINSELGVVSPNIKLPPGENTKAEQLATRIFKKPSTDSLTFEDKHGNNETTTPTAKPDKNIPIVRSSVQQNTYKNPISQAREADKRKTSVRSSPNENIDMDTVQETWKNKTTVKLSSPQQNTSNNVISPQETKSEKHKTSCTSSPQKSDNKLSQVQKSVEDTLLTVQNTNNNTVSQVQKSEEDTLASHQNAANGGTLSTQENTSNSDTLSQSLKSDKEKLSSQETTEENKSSVKPSRHHVYKKNLSENNKSLAQMTDTYDLPFRKRVPRQKLANKNNSSKVVNKDLTEDSKNTGGVIYSLIRVAEESSEETDALKEENLSVSYPTPKISTIQSPTSVETPTTEDIIYEGYNVKRKKSSKNRNKNKSSGPTPIIIGYSNGCQHFVAKRNPYKKKKRTNAKSKVKNNKDMVKQKQDYMDSVVHNYTKLINKLNNELMEYTPV